MPRNVMNRSAALWSTVLGIGLLATGCTDDTDQRTDQPLPCAAASTTYGIDHADLSAVVADEIDLDGDHRPDDALGRGHDLIAAFAPEFDMSGRFGGRLATDIAWKIKVDQCDGQVHVGLTPDVNAAPHYPAVGTITAGGLISADNGLAHLPLLALADATGTNPDPGWRAGDALTIRATVNGDSIDGVFAMAIPTATVRADLAAPIAAFLTTQPADNALRAATDADHDGVVTTAEVAGTAAYAAMTQSDLELVIDDQPQTSVAFRFHATAQR